MGSTFALPHPDFFFFLTLTDPSNFLAKFLKPKMPLSRLTTRVLIIIFMLMVFSEGVEAKREKSEQKWRSCWVTSGVKKVRVKC